MRDLWLSRPLQDMDIVVADNALALAEQLAQKIEARLVIMNRDLLPTARLVLSRQAQIDISQMRAENLRADLMARDFTINALALGLSVCLEKFELGPDDFIDPAGGLVHLAQKIVCPAGPGSMADDPLRIIRAFRFMAELGFIVDDGGQITAALPGLQKIAKPRLGQEWLRLMRVPVAADAIQCMDNFGVLSLLIPGWEAGRHMEQNPYHHLPVLEHSLASVRAMEQVLNNRAFYLGELADIKLEVALPLLKTACLLHDLGKTATMQYKQPGWNSFHYHDRAGVKLAATACGSLGLGSRQTELVADLVGRHMLPHFLLGAISQHQDKSRRLLGRFILRYHGLLNSLMLMALADDMAGLGPARPADLEARLLAVWRDLRQIQQTPELPPPLINGRELMAACALAPGPRLGSVLKHLRALQLEGVIDCKAQALHAAQSFLQTDN